MNKTFTATLALAFGLLHGCARPPSSAWFAKDSSSLNVMFLDSGGAAAAGTQRPNHAQLKLGVIDGSISGTPSYYFHVIELGSAESIAVKPQELAKKLGEGASPLTKIAAQTGLKILPADTRVARATTVLSSDSTAQLVTGFFDSDTKDGLLLVFFDRPCRLYGTVSTNEPWTTPYETQWNVAVTKAGAVWLQVRKTGPAQYTVELASKAPEPMLVTAPLEDYQSGAVHFR